MADQRGTGLVNRKSADDGITKCKQLKCIFDVYCNSLTSAILVKS
jgi:hypothetical protein